MASIEKDWRYERLGEDGKVESVGSYTNDLERKYTGQYIINVKAYFDENPDFWKSHGWTKHIFYNMQDGIEYNRQTQFLVWSQRQVDEYTIEDVYHILDKSEDQLAFEEMLSISEGGAIMFV